MWCVVSAFDSNCIGMRRHHSTNQANRSTMAHEKKPKRMRASIQSLVFCFLTECVAANNNWKICRNHSYWCRRGRDWRLLEFACFGKRENCSGNFEKYSIGVKQHRIGCMRVRLKACKDQTKILATKSKNRNTCINDKRKANKSNCPNQFYVRRMGSLERNETILHHAATVTKSPRTRIHDR